MIEQYGNYEYQIYKEPKGLFGYQIFSEGFPPSIDGVIESDGYFETTQEARFAVIGHITSLEKG